MTKPTLRIIRSLGRSGSTILARAIGCMDRVALFSEIHPTASVSGSNLVSQAKSWFDYEITLEHGFVPAMAQLMEIANADNRIVVLRSWSHVDYLPCGANDYHPLFQATLPKALAPYFDLKILSLVREPDATWKSMTKFPGFAGDIASGHLTRSNFEVGHQEFFRSTASTSVLSYEALCTSPDSAIRSACLALDLPFDVDYASKWPDYHKITGDLGNDQRTISRPTANDLAKMTSSRNIPGYFNFEDLYEKVVAEAPSDRPSTFMEIGVFFGRSLLYLAEKVRESGKPIRIHAVDPLCRGWKRKDLRQLFDEVVRNTSTCPEICCSTPILLPEWYLTGEPDDVTPGALSGIVEAAHKLGVLDLLDFHITRGQVLAPYYPDESIDFCFLDASHTYEETTELIKLYLPKIKTSGILAGHDFGEASYPGIEKAVREIFGSNFQVMRSSFVYRKRT